MIRDAFLWLLTSFVVDPLLGDINRRLMAAGAPQAVISQVQACAVGAPAALADRAAEDPFWGLRTVVGVAIGMTDPASVVERASPECTAAVAAMRPLLGGARGS